MPQNDSRVRKGRSQLRLGEWRRCVWRGGAVEFLAVTRACCRETRLLGCQEEKEGILSSKRIVRHESYDRGAQVPPGDFVRSATLH